MPPKGHYNQFPRVISHRQLKRLLSALGGKQVKAGKHQSKWDFRFPDGQSRQRVPISERSEHHVSYYLKMVCLDELRLTKEVVMAALNGVLGPDLHQEEAAPGKDLPVDDE